jgi:hypothetical protein
MRNDGLNVRISVGIGERGFVNIGSVDSRFCGQEEPAFYDRTLVVGQVGRACRQTFLQLWLDLIEQLELDLCVLVAALAARVALSRRFSADARSASASSICIVSISRTGCTEPSTWMIFSSSKQRTTWMTASVSRILARN